MISIRIFSGFALIALLNASLGYAQISLPTRTKQSFSIDSDSDGQPSQSPHPTSTKAAPLCGISHLGICVKDLAHDQAGIWTSPFRTRSRDLVWLVPFAGATGTSIYFDAEAQRTLRYNKSRIDISTKISDYAGPYLDIGGSGTMYLIGLATHNDKLRETGVLSTEALANAAIVTQVLKLATNRERPDQGDGTGKFWAHGTRGYPYGSSFPSGHAAASWAFAHVVADEYPGWLTRITVYGLASAVSVTRVTASKHFPSDVLVGSTLGYLIGGYVYRHHSANVGATESLMVSPFIDHASHAYGLRLDFDPGRIPHVFGIRHLQTKEADFTAK